MKGEFHEDKQCPWCPGNLVFQDEFFECGYKALYRCAVCGALVWLNSRGQRTKPHDTWVRREWERLQRLRA